MRGEQRDGTVPGVVERVWARRDEADGPLPAGGVVCWLQRSLRIGGNPALDLARTLAGGHGRPLRVFLHLPWPCAGLARHARFLLQGLRELAEGLEQQGAEVLLEAGGDPVALLAQRCRAQSFLLVTDLGFLPDQREELRRLERDFPGPLRVVETETLVPFRQVSGKAEVAARTFRPRFWRALSALGGPVRQVHADRSWGTQGKAAASAWRRLWDRLWEDLGDGDVLDEAPLGGERAARVCLERFLPQVAAYDGARNQPGQEGTSRLSPWWRGCWRSRIPRGGRPFWNSFWCGGSWPSTTSGLLPIPCPTRGRFRPGRGAPWPGTRGICAPRSTRRGCWSGRRPGIRSGTPVNVNCCIRAGCTT